MRSLLRKVVSAFWMPFVNWYLRKERRFNYENLSLTIPPGVFHPAFFFSSTLLASFLKIQTLSRKSLLEIGSGSGLISLTAARAGAEVTALDISQQAVDCTKQNAERNNISLGVFHSNLFDSIAPRHFDIIAVNPPYYKKNPATPAEHAWYCGEELQYFQRFFRDAKNFVNEDTCVFMVLSESCDIGGIIQIADIAGWDSKTILISRKFFEDLFILRFRIANAEKN